MNPSVKFAVITVSMIILAFFFNPWTPFFYGCGIVAFQLLFSRINWKLWWICMLPFAIGAFGYLWTTIVFGKASSGTVIWSSSFFDLTDHQLTIALSLSFRVLAFSMLSLLFAFTTAPVKFVMSLMQQLKLSPKLAYSVLVGYHFLPLIKDEFIQIKQVHEMRSVHVERRGLHRLTVLFRMLIPTLAGSVRKAESAAFAMEARGFKGEARTAYYRPIVLNHSDFWLAVLFAILLAGSCIFGILLES